MQSNVVVVTEPDFYIANQPAILLIGCDHYIESITDNIRRMPVPVTVYQTTEDNTLDIERILSQNSSNDSSVQISKSNSSIEKSIIEKINDQ